MVCMKKKSGLLQAAFLRLFLAFPYAREEKYYSEILKYCKCNSVQRIEHLYILNWFSMHNTHKKL